MSFEARPKRRGASKLYPTFTLVCEIFTKNQLSKWELRKLGFSISVSDEQMDLQTQRRTYGFINRVASVLKQGKFYLKYAQR